MKNNSFQRQTTRFIMLVMLLFCSTQLSTLMAYEKPIIIITQDGEIDDRSSFVRFLLYSNDVDLRGIVATNSVWQKMGHGTSWIYELIDKYGEVLPNLLLHKPDYPSVDKLKGMVVLGNEDPRHLKGSAPYADSEGADLIIRELLKDEQAPVHVGCWGGANTVAHALWKLRKEHPKEFDRAVKRIRIYCISFQDEAGKWIVDNMPEAMIIEAYSWCFTWNYHDKEPLTHNPYPQFLSTKWMLKNIKNNHGPLGAMYQQKNISEGDTPAFLNFVNNGLEAWKDYGHGGWGGRFAPIKEGSNHWKDATDDGNSKKAMWRWTADVQNDFEARMDWCVKSFGEANHAPMILYTSDVRSVKPGEKVELEAEGDDVDKNKLYYHWWHYKDASQMDEYICIENETAPKASFTVPDDCDKDIHIIVEVTDDGEPMLKGYKHLIFTLEN